MARVAYVHKVLSRRVLTHLGCSDRGYMQSQMQMGEECAGDGGGGAPA